MHGLSNVFNLYIKEEWRQMDFYSRSTKYIDQLLAFWNDEKKTAD